jgi:hypothetical protein
LAGVLSACGGDGDGDVAPHVVVDTDFAAVNTSASVAATAGWFTCPADTSAGCVDLAPGQEDDGTAYGVSSSPWWIDPNHAPPGVGYLHLVAYAYHENFLDGGVIEPPQDGRPIDLRNARVTIRWRAPTLRLPEAARFRFWFQTAVTASDGVTRRYVNYMLSARSLVPRGGNEWQSDTLELSASNRDYRCLGSNPTRTDTYGCGIDAVSALTAWNVDLGFIIVFPEQSQATAVSGSVEIDRITIGIPPGNLDTHAQAAYSVTRGAARRPF